MKLIEKLSSTQKIALSFFLVIIVGSLLLWLPISNKGTAISYLDHLFTATTSTCVTGLLTTVVCEQYTLFGQLVILALIQIGGLGFLTLMSLLVVVSKKKLSFTNRILMQEALNQNNLNEIGLYIKSVIRYTVIFEGLGALFFLIPFCKQFGFIKGLYYSIFHSVSAFCNAGIDLLGSTSLLAYDTNVWMNFVVTFLIITGGLGFVVWIDIRHSYDHYKQKSIHFNLKNYFMSLTLQTKLVLSLTLALIVLGTVSFLGLEFNNPLTIGDKSFFEKLLISYFQSVTFRTAGFSTVNMACLRPATKLVACVFMFIGGSPAGTAGGIKTVTFFLVLMHIFTLVQGKENVNVFNRTIDPQIIRRCLSLTIIGFIVAFIALVGLCITDGNIPFIDLTFEIFSAAATVGLTASVTPILSVGGKLIVIVMMYIGRIGPITMLLLFVSKYQLMKGKDVGLAKENVLIG